MRQIGPFEILEKLGAGGMGEVFRARDARLNRFVAIKFLPEAAGSAARERFQREALAIAALNHPYICTLYEAGDDGTQSYLVMELLEGETLHARLARGPAPTNQVIAWGAEIADALQAAHAKGILHRDLKPANIFITQRGSVKVLDFGLAQFALANASDPDAPTVTSPAVGPLTSPGSTLGTYAYMSPEQARGEPTDGRSDIFSLGAVLYECATGKAAFSGRTSADLMAAVLTFTPPPTNAGRLDDIIARCLEKDPALRYQSAADLHSDLKRLQASGSALSAAAAPAAAATRNSKLETRNWLLSVVALIVIAAGGFAWWVWASRPAPAPKLQFRQLTFSGNLVDAVLSPDGKFLAHVDDSPQGTSLHLLSIASDSDVQIMPPATGCCQSPSFSPDGGQVYFLDNGVLKAVPVLGGSVRTIASPACSGAGFSPDGSQIAFVTQRSAVSNLIVADPGGAQAHRINQSPPGAGYLSQCWVNGIGQPTHSPAWSPDGRWIALDLGPVSGDSHIELVDARTGQAHNLGPGFFALPLGDPNWLPDGSGLIFTAQVSADATPQILRMSYPGGKITQLTNDLQGYSAVSVAASGAFTVVHAVPQASIWVQSKPGGEFVQLAGGGADQDGAQGLAWTPQGGLVSFRNLGGHMQIWAEDADGGNARLLAGSLPTDPWDLRVAPNSQMVFFDDGSRSSIWRINADGSGLTKLTAPTEDASDVGPSLALGGREVTYMETAKSGDQTMWKVPLAGGAPQQVWKGYVFAGSGVTSPDGTRLFAITRGGPDHHQPVIVRLDGAQPQVAPVAGFDRATMSFPYGWTADGKAITAIVHQGSLENLWALPLAGGKPYAVTHFTDLRIGSYAFFKDGRLAVSRGTPNADAVLATGLTARH